MYHSKFRALHIDNNSIASSTKDEALQTLSLIPLSLYCRWDMKITVFILCGQTYSVLLVFATQTLSVRRSLRMDQVLAATHDNAVSHLWLQKTVPARASMIGVLTATLYLTTILGLRITVSSLFSLVSVESTRSFGAGTRGLPSFSSSSNVSDFQEMAVYAAGSLYFLPSILDSATSLGLHEGTLYDVLTLDAVPGFNVTCGYVADVARLRSSESNIWTTAEHPEYVIPVTQPGIISTSRGLIINDPIILYSTIPIADSSFKTGPLVNLSPPMHSSLSCIQIFQCSLSLVNQKATVDAQSRQLQALGPDLKKADSTWVPYVRPLNNVTTNGNSFIDTVHDSLPFSCFADCASGGHGTFSSDFPLFYGSSSIASVADITRNVTLHEVENALSIIVASMFWTLGHIPPSHRALGPVYGFFSNGTLMDPLSDVPESPILLQGNATVTEIFTQARLECRRMPNIPYAVSAGLAISIVLILLASPSLFFHRGSTDEKDLSVNGTGIFHAIWLYRNHPELDTLLEQVEHPTDDNLRAAGLVQTGLVGGRVQKERRKLF
ncbi:hypothetical protein B0H13DRAFT_1888050 [Mycena leptocephala]|nr:hypothetical protein B0H13DRAFT_1888050 [Mycena leptocephala]